MAVNMEFSISNDPIRVETIDNKIIEVNLPALNGKNVSVKARLLSYVWREGQVYVELTAFSCNLHSLTF